MRRISRSGLVVILAIGAVALAIGQSKPAAKAGDKAAASKAPAAKGGAVVWSADQAKWLEGSKDMPGLHEAVITGDPAKGASVIYLKIDPGTVIPWHWHTGPEIVYGDSGTLEVGMFKSDKTAKITSGSYAKMPGHMIHKASCVSTEPCMIYIQSPQIFDFHMVDENGKPLMPKGKTEAKEKSGAKKS